MSQHAGQAATVRQSGWLTFSAVVLITAGIMRVFDSIWAFGYDGPLPDDLQDAILGHSINTYGWVWLITGAILITAGVLVLGPPGQPAADISRWVGIIAAALAAISAIFLTPYYPVWSLIYIAIAITAIYGLTAHYGEETA